VLLRGAKKASATISGNHSVTARFTANPTPQQTPYCSVLLAFIVLHFSSLSPSAIFLSRSSETENRNEIGK